MAVGLLFELRDVPVRAPDRRTVDRITLCARGFGGDVRSGREAETVIPIQWSSEASQRLTGSRPGLSSGPPQ